VLGGLHTSVGRRPCWRDRGAQKYLLRATQHFTYPDWKPHVIGLGLPLRFPSVYESDTLKTVRQQQLETQNVRCTSLT